MVEESTGPNEGHITQLKTNRDLLAAHRRWSMCDDEGTLITKVLLTTKTIPLPKVPSAQKRSAYGFSRLPASRKTKGANANPIMVVAKNKHHTREMPQKVFNSGESFQPPSRIAAIKTAVSRFMAEKGKSILGSVPCGRRGQVSSFSEGLAAVCLACIGFHRVGECSRNVGDVKACETCGFLHLIYLETCPTASMRAKARAHVKAICENIEKCSETENIKEEARKKLSDVVFQESHP